MINKIICPTDFSVTADNAVEYAAKLAQLTNAKLEIFHLQPERLLESVFSGTNAIENTKSISQALDVVCREVNRAFHIQCYAHVETPEHFFETTSASEEIDNRLLVMGTNGIDDLYQEIFGTNTFNTLKQTNCPVLIIPESVSYASISKVVLAWDYSIASKNFYPQLHDFLDLFNPEITFLHVSRHNTLISRDLYDAVKENMEELLQDSKAKIRFSRIYTDDIIQGVDEYVTESQTNLLVLIFHDQQNKLLSRNKLIKKISQIAEYPILVLHEIP